jgi:hypothetical protein
MPFTSRGWQMSQFVRGRLLPEVPFWRPPCDSSHIGTFPSLNIV